MWAKLSHKVSHEPGGRGKDSVRKEVLRMIEQGYDKSVIFKRLSISINRFYKIRKKLQLLGFLDANYWPKNKLSTGVNTPYLWSGLGEGQLWRLHGSQLVCPVEFGAGGFERVEGRWVSAGFGGRTRYCLVVVDGVSVQVFESKVVVYLKNFWSVGVVDCKRQALEFVFSFLPVLERRLGCLLKREEGGVVLDWCRREFALEGAFNAVRHVERRERIQVRDKAGGLRAVVDMSVGRPEFELNNPKLSGLDAEKFERFYLDVLEGRWLLLQKGTIEMSEVVKQNTIQIALIFKNLKDKGLL